MEVKKISLTTLLSLLIGLLTYVIFKNSTAYLAGLGAFVIITLLQIQAQLSNSSRALTDFNYLFNSVIKSENSFGILMRNRIIKNLSISAKKHDIAIDKNDVLPFWYDVVSSAQNKIVAINYASIHSTWSTGWSMIAKGIQMERISQGVSIDRIFVLDNDEKYSDYEMVKSDMEQIGINVRLVRKKDLFANPNVQDAYKRLGTLDCSIIDNSWVSLVDLDENRNVQKGRATKQINLVEDVKMISREALQKGK